MGDQFERPLFDGRYDNPPSFTSWVEPPLFTRPSTWIALFRFIFSASNATIPSKEVLDRTLPVQRPEFPLNSSLGATWLGHATVFVRIDGRSVLTDPVWTSHASPIKCCISRRYRPPPCKIQELPEIHFAVISHNHYDHLDSEAVRELSQRFPKLEWIVPKGLGDWMRSESQRATVHELDWGDHITLTTEESKFEVWCIPAQHWSQRTAFDRNKSLWSGWLIKGPHHKFYYTGDTGFCEHEFRKLGEQHGPLDLSAIPIGCYSPRWFMRPQHIDPEEAVKIHQLTKSVKSIGIHWGTYEMGSSEAYLEPKAKLREAVERIGLRPSEFTTLEHGESWRIEREEPQKEKATQ